MKSLKNIFILVLTVCAFQLISNNVSAFESPIICVTFPCPNFTCMDGEDNDLDSFIDCDDFDCHGKQGPNGICDYGDYCRSVFCDAFGCDVCDDNSCTHQGGCEVHEGIVPNHCFDGIDNDGDGLIDCHDPDCFDAHEPGCFCTLPVPSPCFCRCSDREHCFDGIDNDSDGFTDCQDSDCWSHHSCLGQPTPAPGGCTGGGCQPGDCNGDGLHNGQDIIVIIIVIFGGSAVGNTDCNGDGIHNGQDIICIINKIFDN